MDDMRLLPLAMHLLPLAMRFLPHSVILLAWHSAATHNPAPAFHQRLIVMVTLILTLPTTGGTLTALLLPPWRCWILVGLQPKP